MHENKKNVRKAMIHLSLQAHLIREAQELIENVERHPELKDVVVTSEMDARMKQRLQEWQGDEKHGRNNKINRSLSAGYSGEQGH